MNTDEVPTSSKALLESLAQDIGRLVDDLLASNDGGKDASAAVVAALLRARSGLNQAKSLLKPK